MWKALENAITYRGRRNNKFLTLGRQGWHMPGGDAFCENKIKELGFDIVDSVDCSDYEGASIIHDMNMPINISETYDVICDGGTTEHIFNIPQVFDNIIKLLNIGGVYVSVTVNNNFSGHGLYQFSPELFQCTFIEKYGMEIKEIYLAIHGSTDGWIDISKVYSDTDQSSRPQFYTREPIYIIVIAQKISDLGKSLISNPPTQMAYLPST